jgi:hypothetical protein
MILPNAGLPWTLERSATMKDLRLPGFRSATTPLRMIALCGSLLIFSVILGRGGFFGAGAQEPPPLPADPQGPPRRGAQEGGDPHFNPGSAPADEGLLALADAMARKFRDETDLSKFGDPSDLDEQGAVHFFMDLCHRTLQEEITARSMLRPAAAVATRS